MTTSAQAATAAAIDGPLPLVDLAALLRATAAVCGDVGGEQHDLRTAVYTVRDRVTFGTGFPELSGCELGDDLVFSGARTQAAAALCRAVYGRVQGNPVVAALRWERGLGDQHAETLRRMLRTAGEQVTLEAAAARAEALLTS